MQTYQQRGQLVFLKGAQLRHDQAVTVNVVLWWQAVGGREEERRSVASIEELVKAISESKSNGHITV